jgi:hypothetical protein
LPRRRRAFLERMAEDPTPWRLPTSSGFEPEATSMAASPSIAENGELESRRFPAQPASNRCPRPGGFILQMRRAEHSKPTATWPRFR